MLAVGGSGWRLAVGGSGWQMESGLDLESGLGEIRNCLRLALFLDKNNRIPLVLSILYLEGIAFYNPIRHPG